MITIGLSCIFYFGAVLWCPLCRANGGIPTVGCCNTLMVGGVSDRSTDPSLGVIVYGIKRTSYLMLWLGYMTLMIFSSCGCLLEFQSQVHMMKVDKVC